MGRLSKEEFSSTKSEVFISIGEKRQNTDAHRRWKVQLEIHDP